MVLCLPQWFSVHKCNTVPTNANSLVSVPQCMWIIHRESAVLPEQSTVIALECQAGYQNLATPVLQLWFPVWCCVGVRVTYHITWKVAVIGNFLYTLMEAYFSVHRIGLSLLILPEVIAMCELILLKLLSYWKLSIQYSTLITYDHSSFVFHLKYSTVQYIHLVLPMKLVIAYRSAYCVTCCCEENVP